jgi:hypothetical protein
VRQRAYCRVRDARGAVAAQATPTAIKAKTTTDEDPKQCQPIG